MQQYLTERINEMLMQEMLISCRYCDASEVLLIMSGWNDLLHTGVTAVLGFAAVLAFLVLPCSCVFGTDDLAWYLDLHLHYIFLHFLFIWGRDNYM